MFRSRFTHASGGFTVFAHLSSGPCLHVAIFPRLRALFANPFLLHDLQLAGRSIHSSINFPRTGLDGATGLCLPHQRAGPRDMAALKTGTDHDTVENEPHLMRRNMTMVRRGTTAISITSRVVKTMTTCLLPSAHVYIYISLCDDRKRVSAAECRCSFPCSQMFRQSIHLLIRFTPPYPSRSPPRPSSCSYC